MRQWRSPPGLDLMRGQVPQPEEGPYRSRTQVPVLPGVSREVVQDEVTQGLVEILACAGISGLKPQPWVARPLDTTRPPNLLTSKNSQQSWWGQKGTSCPNTSREGRVPSTHIVPPASPLVLPQMQVAGTSQEARLTAAWSQGLRKNKI